MHKAKNCIISCIDFRFQKNILSWLETQGMVGESDLIIVAGSSRDLVKPLEERHKENLLRQLELSIKLHDPDTIIVIDHQDCGGYAQDKTIESGLERNEDKKQHEIYAEIAKSLILEKYPQKNVKNFYADFDGNVEELNA